MAGGKDIKLPVIGEVPKTGVYIGLSAVAVLIGVYYYQHRGSSSAAPAAGAAGQGAAVSGQGAYGSGIYGMGGGVSGQGAYLSGGSYPWDGTEGNPSDPYSLDPATGTTYGDGEGYGSSGEGGPPFATNGAWSQYAENYLITTLGMDASTVSEALGYYIAGEQVTPAQQDIINQATAIAGPPPVTGPGGYPPSIRLASSTASNGTVTVPNVVGMTATDAFNVLRADNLVPGPGGLNGTDTVTAESPTAGSHVQQGSTVTVTVKTGTTTTTKTGGGASGSKPSMPTNVKISGAGPTGFGVSWSPVKGATEYTVRVTYQDALVKQYANVSRSPLGVSGLQPNRTYTVHVAAGNQYGWSSETNGPTGKTTNK
ncbi:MAG TPA: PASTA domain-containing protein [Trebonia sp.]|jgi:hypothetical protein